MSGLVKAKKYDWKDSNMALFGSDTEKKVKKESAESEPAWKGAGQKLGLKIWRIVKFKVTSWAPEEYGNFYEGDSYIILNTYKEKDSDEILYDVHFWIGQYSTQDEYGTAAYKTVELDTFLDDKPVQHREVQGHESALFKSYFPAITIMKGGADSGFRHVTKEEYKPRLLHFHGTRKNITVNEVPMKAGALKSDDVFIVDDGMHIYQWNGATCNKDEKFKAAQYLQKLKSERSCRCNVETLDENDLAENHRVYEIVNNNAVDDDDDEEEDDTDSGFEPELYRLSDSSGSMQFNKEATGQIGLHNFDTKDVFIYDTGKEVFVWVGTRTTQDESRNALTYAHKYLQGTQHPLVSVSCFKEHMEPAAFRAALTA